MDPQTLAMLTQRMRGPLPEPSTEAPLDGPGGEAAPADSVQDGSTQGDLAALMQQYAQATGGQGPPPQGPPPVSPLDVHGSQMPDPNHGPPPPEELLSLGAHQVHQLLAPIVTALFADVKGLKLVSGNRDEHQNRIAKGTPTSFHLLGRAIDVAGSAKALQEAAAWAQHHGAREASIHNPGGGQILHLAW